MIQETRPIRADCSWREKLDYVARRTGLSDVEVLSRAMDEGMSALYRDAVSDAYLRGQLTREEAVRELGPDAVEELDFATASVESDVRWALQRG